MHHSNLTIGPELLNAYVGKSEENVRKLFDQAKKDQENLGRDSPLHVIIFDEFDAIAKPRGSSGDSTGVAANVVNQLLTMIDGVDALNNVLLIGMTNRKDLIDTAILRKGRFGVHIEVGLPDRAGRLQIFKIHTQSKRENNLLGGDVDLTHLADITKNYSGSEIAEVVNSANTFAIERKYNLLDFSKEIKFDMNNIATIDMKDFESALSKVRPSLGVDEDTIDKRTKGPVVNYGKRFENARDTLVNAIKTFCKGSFGVSSVLIHGASGTGKTTMACNIAKNSGIPFVKLLSSEDTVGKSVHGKVKKIADTFGEAYSSPHSVIILDDIIRLIEFVRLGARFSNDVLQALITFLNKQPDRDSHRTIIIGTSSQENILQELGLWDCFNLKVKLPELEASHQEISQALSELIGSKFASQVVLNQGMKINVKHLTFIAESLKLKIQEQPKIDVNGCFIQLWDQVSGDY